MSERRTTTQQIAPLVLNRRSFLAGASVAAIAGARLRPVAAAPVSPKRYRVAVIGHTGHGNYGHGLDRVWLEVPDTEIVAVADADQNGLAAAVKQLSAPKGYADYRKMLDEVKPAIVAVGPPLARPALRHGCGCCRVRCAGRVPRKADVSDAGRSRHDDRRVREA